MPWKRAEGGHFLVLYDGGHIMGFELRKYTAPDFNDKKFPKQ